MKRSTRNSSTNATSRVIEAHGVRVRLYARGPRIWRSIVVGYTETASGRRRAIEDRKPLGHGDWKAAEEQARELCAQIALMRITGPQSGGKLTLKQLHAVYIANVGSLLSDDRKSEIAKTFTLLQRHLGDDFDVNEFSQHHVETYAHARRSGQLVSRGRAAKKGVRNGVIQKELQALSTVCTWAAVKSGKKLIPGNPLHGLEFPTEENPLRPVASRERFEKLVQVADEIDRRGRFRMMLHVAWGTGRRLGSIIVLRASDVLLTAETMRAAFAEIGTDESDADYWPAAIRWSAEADKMGVGWIAPITPELAAMLASYMRTHALIGDALLFPADGKRAQDSVRMPVSKETASGWLVAATKRAGLPRQARGGWHTLRRAWATQRKHYPVQDVMAAGGWKSTAALQTAYQHADPKTMLSVVSGT